VAITNKPTTAREKTKVNLERKFVYLLEKNDLSEMTGALKKHENCAMIVIHSPEELEATPGVVAFLTSLLAEQNINIVEFSSCWPDIIIVVAKEDTLKTYEILFNIVS